MDRTLPPNPIKESDDTESKTMMTIESARRAAQLKNIEQLIEENAEVLEKLGPE